MIPEMDYAFKFIFVTAFAASPVYLLDAFVMPALNEMAETYSTAGETAQEIAKTKPLRN